MIDLPENFDSTFRYIVVVSQRAEQLIRGARLRCTSRHTKSTLQAKDDVDAQLVSWRVLTQEELDAQRQALVEQFRAEVGAEAPPAPPVPKLHDLLPLSTEGAEREVPELGAGERDAELGRLQRLLGMAGADDTMATLDDLDEDVGVVEPAVEDKQLIGFEEGVEDEEGAELGEDDVELDEEQVDLDEEEDFAIDLDDEDALVEDEVDED